MEIKNRIAGEWKLFDEELPPEYPAMSVDLIAEIKDWMTTYFKWDCEECLWVEFESAGITTKLTTAELAEIYDAYCVIQGPFH